MSNNQNIENFKEFGFEIEFKDIVDQFAKECVTLLKLESPRNKYTMNRENGKYADTWVINYGRKRHSGTFTYQDIVWNEKNWQLSHLLENGHLIVNKRGGVGWASPHPHIAPVYEQLKEPYIRAMQNANIRSN